MLVIEVFPYINFKTKIQIIKKLEKRNIFHFEVYPKYIYLETLEKTGGNK